MSTIPAIAFPEPSELPQLGVRTHPVVRYVRVFSRITLLAMAIIYIVFKYVLQPAFSTTIARRFELQNFAYTRLKLLHKRLNRNVKNPPLLRVNYKGSIAVDRVISTEDIMHSEIKESEHRIFKARIRRDTNIMLNNPKDDKQMDDEILHPSLPQINDEANYSTTRLIESVQRLRDKISELKVPEFKYSTSSAYNDGDPEMNSLLYQIKQFKSYLEVVTSEPPHKLLFRKPLSQLQIGYNSKKYHKFNYLDILNDNMDEIKHKLGTKIN